MSQHVYTSLVNKLTAGIVNPLKSGVTVAAMRATNASGDCARYIENQFAHTMPAPR